MTLLARERGRHRRCAARVPPERRRRLRRRNRQRLGRRDARDPRALRARGPFPSDPRAGRRHASGEWVTRMARLAATELRRRLGDQLRRGRVLVAARRDAEGRFRGHPGEIRRRARLLEALPAAARGRPALLRAHDRAALRARVPGRQGDDLPRPPEGRAPGRADVAIEDGNHDADAGAAARAVREPGTRSRSSTSRFARARSSRARVAEATKRGRATLAVTDACMNAGYDAVRRRSSTRSTTDAFVVDDEALERGLADGRLAIDTRLRDALRGLRGRTASFRPIASSTEPPRFPAAGRRRTSAAFADELVAARRDRRDRAGRVTCRCHRTPARLTRDDRLSQEGRPSGERSQPPA